MRFYAATALVLGLVVTTGCAKRTPLSPAELDRVKAASDDGVQSLRVYPSGKIHVRSDLSAENKSYDVEKTIAERSSTEVLIETVKRGTAGLVIDTGELNGAALIYVTFDPSCDNAKCAFSFVRTEDGRFRLLEVPQPKGYEEARVYYRRNGEKRRMTVGKLSSLQERNDVFILKKKNGDVKTIVLEVKKKTAESTTRTKKRNRGID